jgi:hypothetical protein
VTGENEDQARLVRRRWLAIGVATVLMMFSYLSIAFAVVAGESSTTDADVAENGQIFVFGMAMVPFVFLALAFTSNHRRAPGAVLKAMGFFVLVGLPVGLLNVLTGISVGYAAGATTALRKEDYHRTRDRWIAVALIGVYVLFLLQVVPAGGVFAGATLPFIAVGIADTFTEYRVRRDGTALE